jgi:hypothetical protein
VTIEGLTGWIDSTRPGTSATTQVIFSRDGEKATVLLIGRMGDTDALKFYELLNLPVVEQDGKYTKSGEFQNGAGQRAMTIMRQSDQAKFRSYRENTRWETDGVLFVTLNVPGDNNNLYLDSK